LLIHSTDFNSNGGSNVIAQRTLEYYNMGKPREQISLKELEELVQISAFNEGWIPIPQRLLLRFFFVNSLPRRRRPQNKSSDQQAFGGLFCAFSAA
jgi:hypothetical protein